MFGKQKEVKTERKANKFDADPKFVVKMQSGLKKNKKITEFATAREEVQIDWDVMHVRDHSYVWSGADIGAAAEKKKTLI